jgi:hypothetical protein
MKRATRQERAQALLQAYYSDTPHIEDSKTYRVLDAQKLFVSKSKFEKFFSAAQRNEPVYVWHPKAGDTILESGREAISASGHETVFIKKLGHDGRLKIYIPSDSSGPLTESTLDTKYESGTPSQEDTILAALPSGATIHKREPKELRIDILHECITQPAVILNARGTGKHQFLQVGDSLKFEDGECLPLPKSELDTAWAVSTRSPNR